MGSVWQHMTVELEHSAIDYKDKVELFFSILDRLGS